MEFFELKDNVSMRKQSGAKPATEERLMQWMVDKNESGSYITELIVFEKARAI